MLGHHVGKAIQLYRTINQLVIANTSIKWTNVMVSAGHIDKCRNQTKNANIAIVNFMIQVQALFTILAIG